MKKVLVTGGAGFVGYHLIEHIMKNTEWNVVTLDRLDTSGNMNRLQEMLQDHQEWNGRIKFVFHDLKAEINELVAKRLDGPFDYILHLAAGSHVDRSITDPMLFFHDNCIGTVNLLLYAKGGGLNMTEGNNGKFLYFSTDEVFGPAPFEGDFKGYKEWDRHNPNNPYAAAKSAAEQACISFANTYRMPLVITNTMNIFGERQHPEKFIPLIVKKVLNDELLSIHSNKEKTKAGKRHYLHARNVSSAALWVLENGKVLDGSATQGRYNIVGEVEVDNLALAHMVHKIVQEWQVEKGLQTHPLKYELVDFHSGRPGHDLRYALDGGLLASEGFSYAVDFENSLRKTIRWTLEHENWL